MDPLAELIVKNAIFEKADKKTINIKTKNGVSIFSMNKLMQGLAVVFMFIIIGVRVLCAVDPSYALLFSIGLPVIFIFIGTPWLLYQVISKVYIYPDRIVYRNVLGTRKSLYWNGINAVCFSYGRGALRLFGETTNIKISPMFNGFYYIVTSVSENCPEAFDLVSALEPNRNYKEFKTAEGTAVFGLNKLRAVIGSFLLLAAAAGVVILNPILPAITVIVLCGLSGIYLLLSFVISRVLIDNEKITYRSISGETKSLQWNDVTSAELPLYSANSKIVLKGGYNTIKIGSGFSGFNAMQYIIAKRCKNALNK